MASVIQMPKASAGQVTQRDLAEYRVLQAAVRDAKRELAAKRKNIADKLRAGASVEHCIREVELRQVRYGAKLIERLVVRY